MTKKQLQNQIERKLTKLHELLDQMDEVRIIDSDDPETWDSDTLYDLVENCKDLISLTSKKKMLTETGFCALVDEYWSEEEYYD